MNESLQIASATEADAELIELLARQIWPDAYQEILDPEQMEYMLKWMYSPATLRQQMQDGHTFLMAYLDNEAVGFAGFSIKDSDSRYWKLHKLYLLPSTQGKGFGKQLLEEVYRRVREGGGDYLDLNVNRNNKAQFVYQKLGFEIIESGDFSIGNGYFMNDYIMRKKL
ncbi:MAG: GNAT family N-acetyltransferase [Spirosomataceae bacterium]